MRRKLFFNHNWLKYITQRPICKLQKYQRSIKMYPELYSGTRVSVFDQFQGYGPAVGFYYYIVDTCRKLFAIYGLVER